MTDSFFPLPPQLEMTDDKEMMSEHVASTALTSRAAVERMCRTVHGMIWTKLAELFLDQVMMTMSLSGSPGSPGRSRRGLRGSSSSGGSRSARTRTRKSKKHPRLSYLFEAGAIVSSPDPDTARILTLLSEDDDDDPENTDILRMLTEVIFFGGCAPLAQAWPLLKEDIFVENGNAMAFFPVTIAVRSLQEGDEEEDDLVGPYTKLKALVTERALEKRLEGDISITLKKSKSWGAGEGGKLVDAAKTQAVSSATSVKPEGIMRRASATQSVRPKLKLKKKAVKKKKKKGGGHVKSVSGGKRFTSLVNEFVSCFKFASSVQGLKALHPQAHLSLFGLTMQAIYGSYAEDVSDELDLEIM